MNTKVLILNADYQYLNFVDVKKAMKLLSKGKVNIVKESKIVYKSIDRSFAVPVILVMKYMVDKIFSHKVPYNKKIVMLRDSHTCAYCGTHENLTIDHIIPKAQGGKNTFENTCAACGPCNNTKDDRTPAEANMTLRIVPYAPSVADMLRIRLAKMGFNPKDILSFGDEGAVTVH